MHTLVTFLGRAHLDPGTGYRTTRYRFDDGAEYVTPFFGLALAQYLKPDRVLLLGTSGSMWPVLLEHAEGVGAEAEQLELIDAAADGTVTQKHLDALTPYAREALGLPVTPRLIPYATGTSEQLEILRIIAEETEKDDISFDVTHAFRHLAFLTLMSVFMVNLKRKRSVRGLWYGALDMTRDGVTPVLRLDGLLAIEEWIRAIAQFHASGNFAVFCPLLAQDGFEPELLESLEEGWQRLSTSNVAAAAQKVAPFLERLRQPLTGPSQLFREPILKALNWAEGRALWEMQRSLALQAKNRGDWLRAVIFAHEAVVSRATSDAGGDPNVHEDRLKAEERFKKELQFRRQGKSRADDYWLLKNIRNAIAHGTRPASPELERLLDDPAQLGVEIERALQRLTST